MITTDDYSWVRGVNHNWSTKEQVKRELSYGKKVNLNCTRIWLDMKWYEKDPEKYLNKFHEYIDTCYECGYKVMPIIFNGNFLDPKLLAGETFDECKAFMTAVVNEVGRHPGLLMWDLMNEPTCNDYIGSRDITEEVRSARKEELFAFIRRVSEYMRSIDNVTPFTVGHTLAYDIEPTVDCVDVISFHDYSGITEELENNYGFAAMLSKKYNKPCIQSETGCLARCNPYELALFMCNKYHFGFIVYELMIHDRCDSEHGIFYPDGTVRDPATISALMGVFRCRDLSVIIPGLPNREGQAERCIADIKKALTEYTCDGFDYRPSDVNELLNACERAANLLECCDLVPMIIPPTAKILEFRKQARPSLADVRVLAYELALRLKEVCQIL